MQAGCVICYDSFVSSSDANSQQNDDEGRIVASLCGHVFHNSCIQEWLRRSHTCPECRKRVRRGRLTKLFINFCIDNQPDNSALVALQEKLCAKDFECMKKEKKIQTLQTDNAEFERKIEEIDKTIDELKTSIAQSEQKFLEKDEKIKELQINWAHSEQKILEKDEKIKELQINWAHSEQKISEKDEKIKELQINWAHSQLEILEKDAKIQELDICVSSFEIESMGKDSKIMGLQNHLLISKKEISEKDKKIDSVMFSLDCLESGIFMKDQKIEELQTCLTTSKRDLEKMLQQQIDLEKELIATQKEVKRLSCVEAQNQMLLLEKNALKNELQNLNTVKKYVEGPLLDFNQILEEVRVFSDYEKVATNVVTYCSLLKNALTHTLEDTKHLQNEVAKVKQDLVHSEEQRIQLQYRLKLRKKNKRRFEKFKSYRRKIKNISN